MILGELTSRNRCKGIKKKSRILRSGARLVAALGVDVDGGEEAGLRGVRVDPAQRIQRPRILHRVCDEL